MILTKHFQRNKIQFAERNQNVLQLALYVQSKNCNFKLICANTYRVPLQVFLIPIFALLCEEMQISFVFFVRKAIN